MVFIEKNIPVLVSTVAAEKSKRSQTRDGRNFVEAVFSSKINIPDDAFDICIAATQFYGMNTFNNVTTEGSFVFETDPGTGNATQVTVPIPVGCYDIDTFGEVIERTLQARNDMPDSLLRFSYDKATRKVIIEVDVTGTSDGTAITTISEVALQFDNSSANVRELLGFPSTITVTPSANASAFVVGTNIATIEDNIHVLNIHHDATGAAFNGLGNSDTLLLSVPVSVPKGSIIDYQPNTLLFHELKSESQDIQSFLVDLRDAVGTRLAPQSDWWVQLDIRYKKYQAEDHLMGGLRGCNYRN